jgi:hypothetical protein
LAQVEGPWLGTLEVPGAKLRLVLNLQKDGAGFKSTLDSIDQGAKGIPVDFTAVTDGNVSFDVEALKVNYKGKLSADGQTIAGTFTQAGNSFPLELKKTTPQALEALNKKGRPLTPEERSKLVAQLETGRDKLAAAIKGLSESQLKWKQSPERWSVLEITEHLALIEPFMVGLASKRMMTIPQKPELEARTAEQLAAEDKKAFDGYLDRSTKTQAPEPAKPTGRFATGEAAYAAFDKVRTATIDYVKTTDGDLRSHGMPLFQGVMTDAYQLIVMTAAHTERHLLQLQEVKADPGFPKQ